MEERRSRQKGRREKTKFNYHVIKLIFSLLPLLYGRSSVLHSQDGKKQMFLCEQQMNIVGYKYI